MSKRFDFYKGRIESCPSYGFKAGHEILEKIENCAYLDAVRVDGVLTMEEYISIIKLAEQAHFKMMEDNYNEGWS